mgnify:CR=1 FL=1
MLQFLPYALAAYGGYRGYRDAKKSGASGLGRILSAGTGAAMGYYGGKMIPGVSASGFTPFTQTAFAQSLPFVSAPAGLTATGTGQGLSAMQQAQIASSGADPGLALSQMPSAAAAGTPAAADRTFLQKMFYKKDTPSEVDPLKLFAGISGLSYASGAFEQGPVDMYQPTYNVAYKDFAEKRPNFKYIDPVSGDEKDYEKVYIPEGNVEGNPYQMVKSRLREGGLAEVKKFNEGGINYLPSKTSHDEQDANNYVRATGYVEDGSGTGDKDEDTMLAQLADGEFVTRADGVLGAGLIAGANPTSMKDMREKGAAYFYEQQKRYKRIFDLIGEARGTSSKKN